VGVRSWRGVALAGVCLRRGRLAWPGDLKARRADKLPLHQIPKLHDAGSFAQAFPLLQPTVALNKAITATSARRNMQTLSSG
jgi:hypothetical protein